MFCWALELRYDPSQKDYLIYWTSALENEQTTDSLGHKHHYGRTYAVRTRDFKSFSKPSVFFDPGYSQIDASLLVAKGHYYLFHKYSYKGIAYAVGNQLTGPWKPVQPLITDDDWEGVWPQQVGPEYLLYVDRFKSKTRMGAWRSNDLKTWQDVTNEVHFPAPQLHGSVVRVPGSLVKTLMRQQ